MGFSPYNNVEVYKGLIRARLDWAYFCFYNASKSIIRKLVTLQFAALRASDLHLLTFYLTWRKNLQFMFGRASWLLFTLLDPILLRNIRSFLSLSLFRKELIMGNQFRNTTNLFAIYLAGIGPQCRESP